MTESNPQEIELNFSSSSGNSLEENFDKQFEEKSAPAAGEAVFCESAETANQEILLRSRQPLNRPAGTPPLADPNSRSTVTALEMAVAGKSYGEALRILREQKGVTYADLDQITRIQPHYLQALEEENLDKLPPLVYVVGFIRSLARFYDLSDATADLLVAELKEKLEYSCTNEIMNSLQVDSTGAEVNERRLRKIVFGFIGSLLLLVLLIIMVVFWAKKTNDAAPEPIIPENVAKSAGDAEKKFDPNTIYPLLEPPTLDLPKLPVAE